MQFSRHWLHSQYCAAVSTIGFPEFILIADYISLYEYTTFYFSIHWLMNTWLFSLIVCYK